MSSGDRHKFAGLDYLALGAAIALALLAWFIRNMSATYSSLAQYTVVAESSIDGHSEKSTNSSQVAARCEQSGYMLLHSRLYSLRHKSVTVFFSKEYFHHRRGNIFYLDKNGMTRYFHEIFGNDAKLEYFITDTLFFEFPAMEFKKVPVKAMTDIVFQPQFMAKTPLRIMPDSLLIYGNEEQLRGIDRLNTKVIQLRDVNSDCYGEVAVENVQGLRVSTRKVGYSMPVVRYVEYSRKMEVRMEGAPVWLKFQIVPSKVDVTYRLPFSSSDQTVSDPYVALNYSDFLKSRSGYCIGEVKGLPNTVLELNMSTDVFGCVLQAQ